MNLFYVLLGSALGGFTRYMIMSYLPLSLLGNLLFVNVGGSFVFGLLYYLVAQDGWRLFAFVGFLGSFTTLSTLSFEVFSLIQNSHYFYALFYIFISLALSVCAIGIGLWVGGVLKCFV